MLQLLKQRPRLLPAILFLIWCVLVTTWWNWHPPLVPSRKIDMPGNAVVALDEIHNLVIIGNRDQWGSPVHGPVRVVESGRVVRECLTPDDEILVLPDSRSQNRIIVRRDKNYSIVELPSGRTLSKLELDFDPKDLSFVDDSRILLAGSSTHLGNQPSPQPAGQWTTAFDVQTGKRLWSMQDVQLGSLRHSPENATRLLQRLPLPDHGAFAPNTSLQPLSQIIDARTGSVLPQFGILYGVEWFLESPDHHWMAILNISPGWTVYDAISGRVAFTAPRMNPVGISFSPDSAEFRVRRRVSEDEFSALTNSRFRVTDGAVLESHSGPIDENDYATDDGRWELRLCASRFQYTFELWNLRLSRIPYLPRLPGLLRPEPYYVLIDHSRDKIFGALPTGGGLLTNESLTLLAGDSILYYTIPPRRNWGVLLTGLLAPLVIFLGAAGLRRLIRRRHFSKRRVAFNTPGNEGCWR